MKNSNLLILQKVVGWIGIGKDERSESCTEARKCFKYIYPVFAVLTVFDGYVMFSINMQKDTSSIQSTVAHLTVTTLCLVVWYTLQTRSDSLKAIFRALHSVHFRGADIPRFSVLKMILLFNFLLPFFVPSLFLIGGIREADYFCRLFAYHSIQKCDSNLPSKLYSFYKALSTTIESSFFSNLICILYCFLCHYCASLLKGCRESIKKSAVLNQTELRDLGRKYKNIIMIIRSIQTLFSLPSLLIFMISFLEAFVLLVYLMVYTSDQLSLFYVIENISIHLSSGLFAFLIPFFADLIYREMENIRSTFNEVYANAVFGPRSVDTENLHILCTLKDIEPIILSAWHMIDFKRDTVPPVLGTLLTYGLLLLSIAQG